VYSLAFTTIIKENQNEAFSPPSLIHISLIKALPFLSEILYLILQNIFTKIFISSMELKHVCIEMEAEKMRKLLMLNKHSSSQYIGATKKNNNNNYVKI
jgi:hypothetical protein